MRLPVPFIQLPLQFDAEVLAREIAAFGKEHWREHPQKFPGNLWLPLLAVDGDPDNDSFAGPMRPTPYLLQCPYFMQVLSRIGAVWGRTRLMKLTGHAEVNPHFDLNYYWRSRARVHVPVVTTPTVRFVCGEGEVNMAPGECWIFDTWRLHRVINESDSERIHLVADTVGSAEFGELMRNGRMPGSHEPEGWRPAVVAPTSDQQPPLRCESVNLPLVMTPWEMQQNIGFLLRETAMHPQLEQVQQRTTSFLTAWLALWAEFGTDAAGRPAYRRTLAAYEQWLKEEASSLQLVNGAPLTAAMGLMVLSVALAEEGVSASGDEIRMGGGSLTATVAATPAVQQARDALFERPVFIVSPPRSGSTLLFEILAKAPGLFTVGGESHSLIEGTRGLHVVELGYESNRLEANAATPEVTAELRQRFLAGLRDRHGQAPQLTPVCMLEKTPKNALRIPFLAKLFPEARFVYLYRDPRETLSSMIEAWESGRFRTYPKLPGWDGLPWSLLLVPGWRELSGQPVDQVVAAQWKITTQILLDDLECLPAERCHVARYDALLADPAAEVQRLCAALELDWDMQIKDALPLSRYTLSPPAADKWRRHESVINPMLAGLLDTIDRARRFADR